MSVGNYKDLKSHVGHDIVCVTYGTKKDISNVAVECETCCVVLMSYDRFEDAEYAEKMNEKDLKKLFEDKYLKGTCFDSLKELLKDHTNVEINAPRALIACNLEGIWRGLGELSKRTKSLKIKWWAYLHTEGTLQLKRYIDKVSLDDADSSPFVIKRTEPFDADSREQAVKIAKKILEIK